MSDKTKNSHEVELSNSFGTIKKLSKVEFINAISSFSSDEDDSEEQVFEIHATSGY